jgi:7,8-dihydroneopterin aldolase/epimerase/oxygenase
LRIRGYHGVFDHERVTGQDFVVDVVLDLEVSSAARSDDLADTVDYAAVAERVAQIVGGEPVNLLETLATRIADDCLRDSRIDAVEVRVHKPEAPIPLTFDDVVVSVRRARSAHERGRA